MRMKGFMERESRERAISLDTEPQPRPAGGGNVACVDHPDHGKPGRKIGNQKKLILNAVRWSCFTLIPAEYFL